MSQQDVSEGPRVTPLKFPLRSSSHDLPPRAAPPVHHVSYAHLWDVLTIGYRCGDTSTVLLTDGRCWPAARRCQNLVHDCWNRGHMFPLSWHSSSLEKSDPHAVVPQYIDENAHEGNSWPCDAICSCTSIQCQTRNDSSWQARGFGLELEQVIESCGRSPISHGYREETVLERQ